MDYVQAVHFTWDWESKGVYYGWWLRVVFFSIIPDSRRWQVLLCGIFVFEKIFFY